MGRKPRRWAVCITLGVVLAAVAVAICSPRGEDFAFLDSFHPRRVFIDQAKLYQPAAGPRSAGPVRKTELMLTFAFSDRDAVLATLQRKFSNNLGYSAVDGMAYLSARHATFQYGNDLWWTFEKDGDLIEFQAGHQAAGRQGYYENGATLAGTRPPGRTSCILVYHHHINWIERTIRSMRHFLRLG